MNCLPDIFQSTQLAVHGKRLKYEAAGQKCLTTKIVAKSSMNINRNSIQRDENNTIFLSRNAAHWSFDFKF